VEHFADALHPLCRAFSGAVFFWWMLLLGGLRRLVPRGTIVWAALLPSRRFVFFGQMRARRLAGVGEGGLELFHVKPLEVWVRIDTFAAGKTTVGHD